MAESTTSPLIMNEHGETTTQNGKGAGEPHCIETDLLIIGAGPAGAALACFLAQHGKIFNWQLRNAISDMQNRFERHYVGGDAEHSRYPQSPHHQHGRPRMSARYWLGRGVYASCCQRQLHAAYEVVLEHGW
jgi:hypothetical protein